MLMSDREYLAKFALDPDIQNQFGEIELYFEDEIEEVQDDGELDALVDSQVEMEEWDNENQTIK